MLKGTWKVNHAVSESSYNISAPNTFERRVHNLTGQLQARLKQETFLLLFYFFKFDVYYHSLLRFSSWPFFCSIGV